MGMGMGRHAQFVGSSCALFCCCRGERKNVWRTATSAAPAQSLLMQRGLADQLRDPAGFVRRRHTANGRPALNMRPLMMRRGEDSTEAARMSPRSSEQVQPREVARALKAARLAGERPERVEIDPTTGRITVIIARAGEGAAGAVWGLRSLRGPKPPETSVQFWRECLRNLARIVQA